MRPGRLLRMLALALPAISGCGGDVPPGEGQLVRHRFEQDGIPALDYYVYVPTQLPGGPVPLVVYLHGCNQSAVDAAIGTRWNEVAEARKFIVVYPQQTVLDSLAAASGADGHALGCWNWYNAANWNRDAGEPAAIAGVTRAVMAAHRIDPARVYVEGISAGGMMSSIMGATYADLYAAIGTLEGGAYPGGTDLTGTLAAQAIAPFARRMPVFIVHGTLDEAAVYPLGVGAARQWVATNDQLDDGLVNNSVPALPSSTEHHGLDASAIAMLGPPGNICAGVGHVASPCLGPAIGLQGEYPHTIEHYAVGGEDIVVFWTIHGLTHNYLSGNPEGTFTDPLGPDITNAAADFFLSHPRRP